MTRAESRSAVDPVSGESHARFSDFDAPDNLQLASSSEHGITVGSLTIAIVTRNEAEHIERSIASVLDLKERLCGARVILVDSGSTDDTVKIASKFPIEIYRYKGNARSASAGRRIATQNCTSDYIFFLDGDCEIDAEWVAKALARMDVSSEIAVLYGDRKELTDTKCNTSIKVILVDQDTGLGGNALYRVDAITQAGGFQPFLVSEEEAELRSRIEGLGFVVSPLSGIMITHYTIPSASLGDLWKRGSSSFRGGSGHILRSSIGTSRFGYLVRRFNRYLIAAAYMLGLIVMIVGVAIGLHPGWLVAWFGIGIGAYMVLWVRRRRAGDAAFLVASWMACGVALPFGLARGLPSPDHFTFSLEKLK